MPELFKLLARNCLLGVAAGWTTLVALIFSNTAHIYDLVVGSSLPLLPVALLAAGFAITFGSVAMGVAIMTLPYDRDLGKGRGLGLFTLPAMFRAWRTSGHNDAGLEGNGLVPVRVKGGARRLGSR